MPTDTNENSSASTSMITVTDSNNNGSSSSITTTTTTTNHIQSPPLSSSPQPTTIRSNSPIQTLSKQLDKLRRFLSTLYYFGSDISNEIGERVRTLILALVVSFPMEIKLNGFYFLEQCFICRRISWKITSGNQFSITTICITIFKSKII
jgi:hypothetical protein